MPPSRSILIDTNIVIHLEDDKPIKAEFAEMMRRCQEQGVTLCVHEASEEDVLRDKDASRREITMSKLAKFERIGGVATPPIAALERQFGAITDDHDKVDVLLLNALARNAADFLVTEDLGIHKRARLCGLQDRVFRIQEALDWLVRTFEPEPVQLPYIVEKKCYQIDTNDSIFDTLRDGYPEFDEWFAKWARRTCWCLEIGDEIAGIVIRKDAEPRAETDATLPGEKILKISTFKVKEEFRGEKFGEHLLKQVLWYAQKNDYDLVYLTAYENDQEVLADLLQQFGFIATAKKQKTGEQIFEKRMIRGPAAPGGISPLTDDLASYPCFREDGLVETYVVPIQPRWHRILFPENSAQPTLLEGSADADTTRTPGNTIRKVYLCRTPAKTVNPGDIILFYVSGKEFESGYVRTVGIVESMRAFFDPVDLLRATGRRSVYTEKAQLEMLESASSPVKVIDFLLIGHFEEPVPIEFLIAKNILRAAPQSFVRLDGAAARALHLHELLGYS
jgi:ribosomal protein S18 acetylase RimI-like enzyme